ncbi:hypothetical protein ASG23_03605 [Cellulomonas sp. Leaf395]|nr:hypothetical protein ASG23_03605 [Cellulomonas sp. Leaf395]
MWGGSGAAEPDADPEASTAEPGADEPIERDATEPTADEPSTGEPAAGEPAATEPTADEPSATEPTADEPSATEPTADEPTADDAVADRAGAVEQVPPEPVVDEESTAELATDEEVTAEPVVDEEATAEQATDGPDADSPTVDVASSVEEPVATENEPVSDDAVAESDAGPEASTDEPDAEDEVVGADGADEPVADQPVVDPTPVDGTTAGEVAVDEAAEHVGSEPPSDIAPEPTDEDVSPAGPDDAPEQSPKAAADPARTDTDTDTDDDTGTEPVQAAVGTATAAAATTTEPRTTEPTTTEPTKAEAPERQPGGREAATAVIAPVVGAPQAPAPASATPVGTLAAPVTRTVPGSAPSMGAPTQSGAVPPSGPTAAAAATAATAVAAGATSAGRAAPTAGTPTAAAQTAVTPTATAPTAGTPTTAAAPSQPRPQARIPSGPVPPSERSESPLDVFEAEDGKRRWPKRLLIVAAVIVALAAVYVGATYALEDRVPRGATVAGVDIGGLSTDEAVALLEQELADATTQPIEVVANDVQASLDPTAAGLTFDAQATVDELTGMDLAEPARLWAHLAGVDAQDPVTSVDEEALSAAIGDLGTSLALAPVDGTVVFVDATPQSTAAVDGWNLDQAGAADALASDWLVAARPIELPTAAVEPDITQEETDAALAQAQQVTSAPVTVSVGGRTALIDAPTLAANASFVPADGNLSLQMNGEGLAQVVLTQLPDLLTQSADARFEFVNGAPVVVPGIPGTSLDPAALATSVTAATASGDRGAPVELVQADPSESTAELEALGVKEIVSEFATPLNSEPRRTANIANGASKISGTLIRPGEIFSLTKALGPIDAAHGYVEAGAIVSGEHVDAWGGGLSQVSTTTYNAAFLAGFEDVEHRPHSEWFSRYPEGREATIFTGTLDMRWKNNTPYGALVQAWVADGRVYVRVWGTKHWTVESITSGRSGVVAPTTVYSQSPTCEPQSAGNPGFSVTVTRKTYLNGALEKTESNSWRYKPQNKVICGAAPTPAPTP